MSEFSGTLNILNGISRLDGDLLLKAGIPDETQAKAAATTFLQSPPRNLQTNQSVVITGEKPSVGKIRMSDARAASPQDSLGMVGTLGFKATVAARTQGLLKRKKRRVRGNVREEFRSRK